VGTSETASGKEQGRRPGMASGRLSPDKITYLLLTLRSRDVSVHHVHGEKRPGGIPRFSWVGRLNTTPTFLTTI
jgi:hypothetical protein